jgi:hypothetical protein
LVSYLFARGQFGDFLIEFTNVYAFMNVKSVCRDSGRVSELRLSPEVSPNPLLDASKDYDPLGFSA